jgi:hypothetical protein
MLELSSDQSWGAYQLALHTFAARAGNFAGNAGHHWRLTLFVLLAIFLIPAVFPWLIDKKYRPESMSALRWALPVEASVDSAVTF